MRASFLANNRIAFYARIRKVTSEGKVDKRGLPKNPLQFAATLRTLVKYGDTLSPLKQRSF